MEILLRPKNIIIVGGGSGIGFAVAEKALNNGVENIILASRNFEKLKIAVSKLKYKESQKVFPIEFDIAAVSRHNVFIEKVQEMIGCIPDGLVISSGVNFDGNNWKGFNISENDYDKIMEINLKGVFFLIRNFSNYLHGHKSKGNICVVSSISAHRDLLSVYQITKNAVSGIVHAYGKHLCERGVILNCVEPGTTNTEMMKNLGDYTDGVRGGNLWQDNSIRRLLRAEEIAEIICFAMSDLGEALAGSCILAGGGCKSIAR
ncbi:MAG: SDR family oxidoreductase [Blautia sp.]|nr:SDR family oxidoreductase [Lachnoclostridium sp.]MCM1211842.1 SDR family oxidoreductase [Blautia sp.]